MLDQQRMRRGVGVSYPACQNCGKRMRIVRRGPRYDDSGYYQCQVFTWDCCDHRVERNVNICLALSEHECETGHKQDAESHCGNFDSIKICEPIEHGGSPRSRNGGCRHERTPSIGRTWGSRVVASNLGLCGWAAGCRGMWCRPASPMEENLRSRLCS